MSKNAKIERTQKAFLAAMKKKFSEDPEAPSTIVNQSQSQKEHVTLLPLRSCKPDPFDEEADEKYDHMINSRNDWEMKGYQRK